MNRKMIFFTFGRILQTEGALLLLPTFVSLGYGEMKAFVALLVTAIASALAGTVITALAHTENKLIYAREGFAITALAWIGMSLVGALPFVISGEVSSYVDAFFETVSGFTTTGASCLKNYTELSHGIQFWRCFTHWIGGMGVLVFVMAIVSNMSDRSIHIMRAEMPGPVIGKLVPKAKDTAKILYGIYIALTVFEILFLWKFGQSGGMNLYEATIHSLSTAGTGGFGSRADSIASYSSYCKIVITVFMLLFGVNFNLYFLMLIRRFKAVFQSTELRFYIGLIVVFTLVITANIYSMVGTFGKSLEDAAFQVAAFITTTGYTTTNPNLFPGLAKGLLLLLMFFGSCAGSTAGGLKLSRVLLLIKMIGREMKKLLHPRAVTSVNFEGKDVDNSTLSSVATYFAVYALCIIATFLLVCFEPFGFETNFTAAVSAFNNIGPIFGTKADFCDYSIFSKLVFSLSMMLGRLEIFPIVIALSPSTWLKK